MVQRERSKIATAEDARTDIMTQQTWQVAGKLVNEKQSVQLFWGDIKSKFEGLHKHAHLCKVVVNAAILF